MLSGYSAFLTLQYWFNPRPVPMPQFWIIGLNIFFGLFIAAGVVFNVLSRRADPFLGKRLRRLSKVGWVNGILGYIWLFFSYEGVVFLGARFWFLVILLSTIVWKIFILVDLKKNVARERAERQERERFEKYLPKKKK